MNNWISSYALKIICVAEIHFSVAEQLSFLEWYTDDGV